MRENGPAEYGEGTTLTAVAAEIGEQFGVRSQRVLGDLTRGDDIARVVAETEGALGPIEFSSTMPAAISRPPAASPIRTTR